ncbi:MAG: serine hydrolase domain-containing protein [Steroidobacter sp.]
MKYLLSALLLVAGLAVADAPLPNTPAGKILGDFLVAFNSGDAAKVKAFNRRNGREQAPPDGLLEHREMSGGLTLLRVLESEPRKIVVLAQEKDTERPLRIELTATGGSAPIMDKFGIKGAELPPDLAPKRLTQEAALRALTERIDQLAKTDRFSGVVVIARGDQILLQKAAGKSNRETGADVTLETQFRLGSQNKMFTSVATLQLVEAGKLALREPIGKYLTDYPNLDLASKVTIHHLLSHTGGTGDIFGPQFDTNRLSLRTHGDYLKLYGARQLAFEPGSDDRYSNYGFVLLGALIEKVTGQSYYDYVRQKIFEPAGMSSTASLPESETVPRRVTGYMRKEGRLVANTDTLPYRGTSAGGGYSTAGDMLRFAKALEAGELISKEMLRVATSPQNKFGGYGYGLALQGTGKTHSYGHSGGAPGMNADLRIFPELGYVIVALSNLDPPAASMLAEYYVARMPVD